MSAGMDMGMDVGFIGLGIMGTPMAGHLLDAGHRLHVHARKAVPAVLRDRGVSVCPDGRAVAAASDVVVVMVPDTPDVEAVLFGPAGVASGLTPGKTVVDMSSICPLATKDFARRIGALGCDYLDAPVSGGEVGARTASLTIMVGGSPDAFDRVEPLLGAMGKTITRVGDPGAGQTAKVANQILVALTIEAVGEALLFASRAGADPVKVRQALMGGFASSRVLELHGDRMIRRDAEPGFRIDLHRKDLALALDGAEALDVALPLTGSCQQMFNACVAQGGGGWDHSALVRILEGLAGHRIGQSSRDARSNDSQGDDLKSLGYVLRLMADADDAPQAA